jgi:sugar (pentulose or hexulose) kinase
MMLHEEHLPSLCRLTTLSGYIHGKLTGRNVLGICEASGMFPIDSQTFDYSSADVEKFDALASEMGYNVKIKELLPTVLRAGEDAGYLTEEGARFLDESGQLQSGIPFAPPEGDGGTGMVSTNSLRVGIGNVSAGTSAFALVVADHEPNAHEEIDMVTTPSGAPVAMVHCNNCTSDINAWAKLFGDFLRAMGMEYTDDELYSTLFNAALSGDADCGGLLAYNFESGEHIVGVSEGRPLFVRRPASEMTLGNFMRTHLYSALASLKIGLNILINEENIRIDKLYAHGGFFRVPEVGQKMLSAAVASPVSVMETADSGGPYGMSLLAAYRLYGKGESLEEHLEERVFSSVPTVTLMADKADIDGFGKFFSSYVAAFDTEKTAIKTFE